MFNIKQIHNEPHITNNASYKLKNHQIVDMQI
jgi:hypothetical protein